MTDWADEILAHPVARVVAEFRGLDIDSLTEAEKYDLVFDVEPLLIAANSYPLPKARKALTLIRKINKKLDEAEALAAQLAPYIIDQTRMPGGQTLPIALRGLRKQLYLQLTVAERISAREAQRTKQGKGPRLKREVYLIALHAAQLFERHKGPGSATVSHDDKEARSPYGRFLVDVLRALYPNPSIRPGWYDYANWAVTLNRECE